MVPEGACSLLCFALQSKAPRSSLQAEIVPSLLQVLEMLEKGETPPNIRTDIVDEPPNPSAAPSSARMKPRPKPWERSAPPAASSAFPAFASGGSGGDG